MPLSDVRVELRIRSLFANEDKPTKGGKKENGTSGNFTLELVPGGKALEYEKNEKEGVVSFVVPSVVGHQMVCLSMK